MHVFKAAETELTSFFHPKEQIPLKPLCLLDYKDHSLFKVNVLENLIVEYSDPACELLIAVAEATPEKKNNPDLTKMVGERLVKQATFLLAHKASVIDLVGNTFQKITAFQYAV